MTRRSTGLDYSSLAGERLLHARRYRRDALARRYETLPLAAALWSTGRAIDAWVSVLPSALSDEIVLQHQTRGMQRAEDVVRNNCHDAHHHLWERNSQDLWIGVSCNLLITS